MTTINNGKPAITPYRRNMSLSSLILILLSFHQQHQYYANAARSLSARRVRGAPTARAADKYDRSITTFSPEGRLLQLEYALVAAEERGRGLTVCVECEGVVVFAFPSSDDDDEVGDVDSPSSVSAPDLSSPLGDEEDGTNNLDDTSILGVSSALPSVILSNIDHNPTHNTKIHRLSPTHLLLTSGLAGDSRTLASAFRRLTSSWTHINYGEVVTAREVAQEMGRVRHGIGLRPGARVLGVMGMLIGLDDLDDVNECERIKATNDLGVEVRMYRSLPGGTLDRCNVCCTGGGADALGNAARKDAMESLLSVVSPDDDGDTNSTSLSEEEALFRNEKKLQRVVEEVGRIALKYHPDSEDKDETPKDEEHDNRQKKRAAVDIWAVCASPSISTKQNDRNTAFVSPHRFLGKALMETKYARRVAVDQLSVAAQCLIQKDVKI